MTEMSSTPLEHTFLSMLVSIITFLISSITPYSNQSPLFAVATFLLVWASSYIHHLEGNPEPSPSPIPQPPTSTTPSPVPSPLNPPPNSILMDGNIVPVGFTTSADGSRTPDVPIGSIVTTLKNDPNHYLFSVTTPNGDVVKTNINPTSNSTI